MFCGYMGISLAFLCMIGSWQQGMASLAASTYSEMFQQAYKEHKYAVNDLAEFKKTDGPVLLHDKNQLSGYKRNRFFYSLRHVGTLASAGMAFGAYFVEGVERKALVVGSMLTFGAMLCVRRLDRGSEDSFNGLRSSVRLQEFDMDIKINKVCYTNQQLQRNKIALLGEAKDLKAQDPGAYNLFMGLNGSQLKKAGFTLPT